MALDLRPEACQLLSTRLLRQDVEALEFNRNVLPLLVLLAEQAVLKCPHSEVSAQKPLPSEETEDALLPSVAAALKPPHSKVHALTLLLSVVNAHKPLRDVVPPLTPPFSVVTAVVPHRSPQADKLLAPQVDVSPLPPLIDVMALQDPIALAVPQDLIVALAQADPNRLLEASRDAEPHQLLLLQDKVAHRGLPEVKSLTDPLADPSTRMAVE